MHDIVPSKGPLDRIVETSGWPNAAHGHHPRFSVKIAREGGTLGLMRDLTCGDEFVLRSVTWTRTFRTEADANEAIDALGSSRGHYLLWSACTAALGPSWLDPTIDAIIAAAAKQRETERERLALERQRADDEAHAAMVAAEAEKEIRVYFLAKAGEFLVSVERGSFRKTVLWTIAFDEAWERDRFWDWFGWQRGRYEEMTGSLGKQNRLDLERQLLREMLVTEQAVKKKGLGSGGRRPLRFWRGEAQ